MTALIAEFWPYLAGGFALVLAYFGVRMKGKADGKQEVRDQINKQAVESAKESRDVQTKIDRMDDAAVVDEFNRRWVRRKGKGGQ